MIHRLLKDTNGQDVAEYALSLGILSLGMFLATYSVLANVQTIWVRLQNVLALH